MAAVTCGIAPLCTVSSTVLRTHTEDDISSVELVAAVHHSLVLQHAQLYGAL
jgi:hypothetical protein